MSLPNEQLQHYSQDLFYSGNARFDIIPGTLNNFPTTLKDLIFTENPELAPITDSYTEEFSALIRDLMISIFSRETQSVDPIILTILMSHGSAFDLQLNVSRAPKAINFDDTVSLYSHRTAYGVIYPTKVKILVPDTRLQEKTNAPGIIQKLRNTYPEWIDFKKDGKNIEINLQGIIDLRNDIVRIRDSFK